ncbi:unnamed protein product [Acanthoscelides obtectus]|uniref:Neuropeptide-like 1 n=1 Tax=Acanthoscelides obtectus TaxID=200917 RepID=A0A9P0Q2G6_ACAOB|nr:unnamed protein product [Acanthoscelides obtectus]CAK1649653.1 Neuropeptide-like 1 [Acanthoscelides obtectus]
MKMFLVTRVFLTCYVLLYWSAHAVVGTSTESSCDIDIEDTLRALLADQDSPSIQVQALRRDLLRKIQEILERKALEDEESYYKRSLAALAASNNLPGKRNLEALARNGYIKTLPEEEDPNYKRSVANLAKNGQFPLRQEEPKRGIASLARNGDLRPPRKGIQDTLDDLYGKRNIASLARNYELPNYQIQYKRNIASVARNGKFTGKRSVAPAVPQRRKREITDYQYENEEYPQLVHQNILDYEDMIQDLNAPIYDAADKRFLGSVAKSGWFRPQSLSSGSRSTSTRYQFSPGKRHIGALARLGWLPSLRNIRRFNRSGRSASDACRLYIGVGWMFP